MQEEGQVRALPLQAYGAQDGLPPLPTGAVMQEPTDPVTSQRWHGPPLQALLQQMPPAQKPVEH